MPLAEAPWAVDEEEPHPSDIQGLIYIPFHDRVTEAGTLLAKELSEQGIPIAVKDL